MRWSRITEKQYHDAFEVLPPIMITSDAFMVSEPWDHHAGNGKPRYAAYIRCSMGYYTSSRPMTVAEFRAMIRNWGAIVNTFKVQR